MIINWNASSISDGRRTRDDRVSTVDVLPSSFLSLGDTYRVMDPRDFFGEPVAMGTFDGAPIRLQVAQRLAVFVILKEAGDCNGNSRDDDEDIVMGFSDDCNMNLFPDECEVDCNGSGMPDLCDISSGLSRDRNYNGIPDECELAFFADLDNDNDVDLSDFLSVIQCFGGPNARPPRGCCRTSTRRGGPCDAPADLDGDGDVDLADIVMFQAAFAGP